MIFSRKPSVFDPRFIVVSCFCEVQGRFLLLKRSLEKEQGGSWCRLAGKVEKGESLKNALLRESAEETGIELKLKDLKSHNVVYIQNPRFDYIFHIYKVELNSQPVVRLNNEHIDFKWATPQEALKLNLIQDEDAVIKLFYKLS